MQKATFDTKRIEGEETRKEGRILHCVQNDRNYGWIPAFAGMGQDIRLDSGLRQNETMDEIATSLRSSQ